MWQNDLVIDIRMAETEILSDSMHQSRLLVPNNTVRREFYESDMQCEEFEAYAGNHEAHVTEELEMCGEFHKDAGRNYYY